MIYNKTFYLSFYHLCSVVTFRHVTYFFIVRGPQTYKKKININIYDRPVCYNFDLYSSLRIDT